MRAQCTPPFLAMLSWGGALEVLWRMRLTPGTDHFPGSMRWEVGAGEASGSVIPRAPSEGGQKAPRRRRGVQPAHAWVRSDW